MSITDNVILHSFSDTVYEVPCNQFHFVTQSFWCFVPLYFIKVSKVKGLLLHNGCDDDHCVAESALQDDALMFCNPEASSVLDPDQGSQDGSSELPNLSVIKPVPESNSRIGESSQEIVQPAEQLPEEPRHSTCTEHTGESNNITEF